MIKARINGENIVIPTDVEELRDANLFHMSGTMLSLIGKYEHIANKGTPEAKAIYGGGYPNKMQDTASERTLRYIAEKVLKTKDYTIERIESPDATPEEEKILMRIY